MTEESEFSSTEESLSTICKYEEEVDIFEGISMKSKTFTVRDFGTHLLMVRRMRLRVRQDGKIRGAYELHWGNIDIRRPPKPKVSISFYDDFDIPVGPDFVNGHSRSCRQGRVTDVKIDDFMTLEFELLNYIQGKINEFRYKTC